MKIKKLNHTLLIPMFLLFLWSWPIWGASYYVKADGDDNLDGLSDATAWATIDRVHGNLKSDDPVANAWAKIGRSQSSVKNGDTVYFRSQDIWIETKNHVINADIDGVTYDGSTYGNGLRATLKAGSKLDAVVKISANNINFKGFNIDMNAQITGGIYIGTYAKKDISSISIDNCKVHDNSMPKGNYGYGIHIGGYAAANVQVSNVIIVNTEVYNTGHEAFAIYPTWTKPGCTAKNITIRNCIGRGAGRDGDDWGQGLYIANRCQNVNVEFSTFNNNDVGVTIGTSKYYTGSPTLITLRYNLIYNNKIVELSMQPGERLHGMTGTIDVYSNIIYGSNGDGIWIGGKWNNSIVKMFNNTVYSSSPRHRALCVNGLSGSETPFYLINNIFVSYDNRVFKFYTSADLAYVYRLNNLIYRVTGSHNQWFTINTHDYNAAAVNSGANPWDKKALNIDPMFKGGILPTRFSGTYGLDMEPNSDYFSIMSRAARKKGVTLGSPYNGSINGAGLEKPYLREDGAYDIGAYQTIESNNENRNMLKLKNKAN